MKVGDLVRFSGRYLTQREEDSTHRFVIDVRPRDGIVTELGKQSMSVLSKGENIMILLRNAAIGPANETTIEVISESEV